MEQFLGVLKFSKRLGRTLVLPHLTVQPLSNFFKLEPLNEFTPVIPMDDFMNHIAPIVWPQGTRKGFHFYLNILLAIDFLIK